MTLKLKILLICGVIFFLLLFFFIYYRFSTNANLSTPLNNNETTPLNDNVNTPLNNTDNNNTLNNTNTTSLNNTDNNTLSTSIDLKNYWLATELCEADSSKWIKNNGDKMIDLYEWGQCKCSNGKLFTKWCCIVTNKFTCDDLCKLDTNVNDICEILNKSSKNTLKNGEILTENNYLIWTNYKYYLVINNDGNVNIYDNIKNKLWSTDVGKKHNITTLKPPFKFIMQSDGNLVLYDNTKPIWASNTYNNGDSIVLTDDGKINIYDKKKNVIWSS